MVCCAAGAAAEEQEGGAGQVAAALDELQGQEEAPTEQQQQPQDLVVDEPQGQAEDEEAGTPPDLEPPAGLGPVRTGLAWAGAAHIMFCTAVHIAAQFWPGCIECWPLHVCRVAFD